MNFPFIDPDDADRRFMCLQEELAEQFERAFPDPLAPKTVLVLPSLSLDPEILIKLHGLVHYEERMLCLLMLLRMPRTHLVFISSVPIQEEIVDYYLHLLPGITGFHARRRLTLLSCYDATNRPLTEKILRRPRLLQKIRESIPPGHAAHITCFNVTELERTLALELGIPLYGCPPEYSYWGTKSGSRKVFRNAGLLIPAGFEDLSTVEEIAAALQALRQRQPDIRKAMIKLNDGFSGDGNAIYTYKPDVAPEIGNLEAQLRFVAKDMDWPLFADKFHLMGGIVEAFVEGAEKRSPSVQCRINPLRQINIVSTHDQILSGEDAQIYTGATFPAHPAYSCEIGRLGFRVARELTELGILGRFSVDFISVKTPGGWDHYAIEINLRKGGTTHPYLMLQFLTDGTYDYENGVYRMPNGQSRFYFATDALQSDKYCCLTPADLIDLAICNDIHFDATVQEGVTFHLIGAISQFGKLGVVCIGRSPERALELYGKTVAMLEREVGCPG